MSNKSVAEYVVERLNEALTRDAISVSKLFTYRVQANKSLASRDSIIHMRDDGTFSPMGVLNGLMDSFTDDEYRVAATLDAESGLIDEFKLIRTEYVTT